MVREAIVKELKRQKRKRYWLWKESGVPRSVAYDGLDGDRPIPLEHAEAMMKALGLTVKPSIRLHGVKKNAALALGCKTHEVILAPPPRRAGKRKR